MEKCRLFSNRKLACQGAYQIKCCVAGEKFSFGTKIKKKLLLRGRAASLLVLAMLNSPARCRARRRPYPRSLPSAPRRTVMLKSLARSNSKERRASPKKLSRVVLEAFLDTTLCSKRSCVAEIQRMRIRDFGCRRVYMSKCKRRAKAWSRQGAYFDPGGSMPAFTDRTCARARLRRIQARPEATQRKSIETRPRQLERIFRRDNQGC